MLSDFLRLIKGFILFLGPSEAGKTSILRRLVTGEFKDQEPTLGFREEYIAKVRIIEIGGQKSFRKYWEVALEQNPARLFFIIDVSKENDFNEYLEFMKGLTEDSEIRKKTILIVNKTDLVLSTPDFLHSENIQINCSAKSGEGMLDILESIAGLKNETEVSSPIQRIEEAEQKENSFSDDIEEAESILKEFQGKF
ncbi:MAG: ADP-ribosylation factor-like protein [Candidatus Hodarchaeales archaeon]